VLRAPRLKREARDFDPELRRVVTSANSSLLRPGLACLFLLKRSGIPESLAALCLLSSAGRPSLRRNDVLDDGLACPHAQHGRADAVQSSLILNGLCRVRLMRSLCSIPSGFSYHWQSLLRCVESGSSSPRCGHHIHPRWRPGS